MTKHSQRITDNPEMCEVVQQWMDSGSFDLNALRAHVAGCKKCQAIMRSPMIRQFSADVRAAFGEEQKDVSNDN